MARRRLRPVIRRIEAFASRSAHVALLMLALLAGTAHAASDEAARLFQSGSTAFKAGDYVKALEGFEQALAAGMSGPAIHFNIGVAAYRSGNYSRAETAFNEAAETPAMSGLAYYNLGLVSLARKDSAAAERWFARAEQAATDSNLRGLAAERLGELRPETPRYDWVGYASFALGHDDNVALVSNSNVLGISDTEDNFGEAQFLVSTPLNDSWRLDGGIGVVDYQDLNTFDQIGANAGARYRWTLGDWSNDAGVRLGYSALDGSGFENRRTLSLRTSRDLGPDLQVLGGYRFHHIQGLNEYSGLTGHEQEVTARLEWAPPDWDVGVEYQLELADYEDETLSATRHQFRIDVERTLVADWNVLFEATRRYSDYDVTENGSEERTELALTVTKPLTSRWRLVVRHTYTDNQADLRAFDYRGNRLSAGVEATL